MVVLEPVSGGLRTNGREVPPSGLKPNSRISTAQRALRAVIPLTPPAPSPPVKALVGRGGQAAWRFSVGWVKRALPRYPPSRMGGLPDTFLISARDPLPLRLCTFASLRSFLLVARSLREIHCPNSLARGLSPWHVLVDQSELL